MTKSNVNYPEVSLGYDGDSFARSDGYTPERWSNGEISWASIHAPDCDRDDHFLCTRFKKNWLEKGRLRTPHQNSSQLPKQSRWQVSSIVVVFIDARFGIVQYPEAVSRRSQIDPHSCAYAGEFLIAGASQHPVIASGRFTPSSGRRASQQAGS
jgi:hypothetical protein